MRDPLPSLREENSNIPQSIENIILKATAKNPKNRYEDAKSMHDDLLTALNEDRMNEEVYKYKYPEHENEAKNKKDDKKNTTEEVDVDEGNFLSDEADDSIATKIEDEDNKKNITLIVILSSILAILVIALVVVLFVLPESTQSKNVIVPDCENLKVSACEKKLQKLGFVVETDIELVESSTIEKNLVVKTKPEAGRSVKEGTKVVIYKSIGEEVYEIEDYTGKNYIEVQTILETKYGLKVTVEKKVPADLKSKEYDEQEIIGQSLAVGSEVKVGESITLFIPDITDTFPDMNAEGWSLEDAEAFCTKYGLVIKVTEIETEKYAPGKIVTQTRAAGSPITRGSTLGVEVAKKPTVKVEEKPKEENKTEEVEDAVENTEEVED
jgi:serine/threonine-protein kinase